MSGRKTPTTEPPASPEAVPSELALQLLLLGPAGQGHLLHSVWSGHRAPWKERTMKKVLAVIVLSIMYVPVKVIGLLDEWQQLADRDDGGSI